jgi:hypothetical protein
MWLDFETRMRGLIRRVIEPTLKLSIEDREASLTTEMRLDELITRTELLEQALFLKSKQLSRTIFDDYNDKLSEMNIFLLQESKRLNQVLETNRQTNED